MLEKKKIFGEYEIYFLLLKRRNLRFIKCKLFVKDYREFLIKIYRLVVFILLSGCLFVSILVVCLVKYICSVIVLFYIIYIR